MDYTETAVKAELTESLDHARDAFVRIEAVAGKGKALRFPDVHKVAEGLFLSCWTRWEYACQRLVILDVATVATGVLQKEVKEFRYAHGDRRLAERIVGHPDEQKWVEWSNIEDVLARAEALLGPTHRYAAIKGTTTIADLRRLRKVRNAVAHKSDSAWESFTDLAKKAPYNLTSKQMKFITVGRFLASHDVAGTRNVLHAVEALRSAITILVP